VLAKTSRGSIIVFHDSVKASKNMQYALPKVLAHFSEKGYCFKALNSIV
jgi:peptidoglycan/xylan/chitin deacetylase (PgdA/CDA1 family)